MPPAMVLNCSAVEISTPPAAFSYTAMTMLSEMSPIVAVIVVLPTATPVIVPSYETDATLSLLLVQTASPTWILLAISYVPPFATERAASSISTFAPA